jgi:eukaryotic-like serine/threonine-protein kinase
MGPFGSIRRWLKRGSRPSKTPSPKSEPPGTAYKKGDFIGKPYEVLGILGVGGFSVVYLVHSHETGTAFALKTLRDQFLQDPETADQFKREARVWVNLERHPNVVTAYFIDELAGRLYIGMEYIAPNNDGLNSLEGYLASDPPELPRALRWCIQFCHGMEHARSRGIRSHRDIKPANIMITANGLVKITDFGFADVIDRTRRLRMDAISRRKRMAQDFTGFGTPNYMPPEQFLNATRCDERSDIYSFGVVMYQLASGGRLPFAPPTVTGPGRTRPDVWRDMHRLHTEARVPTIASPLFPVIKRCLEKEQRARYQSFRDLRVDLEALLAEIGGEKVVLESPKELQAWELYNKAFSLASLGDHTEAIRYYDRVLELEPSNSDAWNNRGSCCKKLGRVQDALQCYENAIHVQPYSAAAWSNKGNALSALGKYTEAIVSLNRAIEVDAANESAWLNKALVEDRLGLVRESLSSFQKFITLRPVAYAEHLEYARKRIAELKKQQTLKR